MADTWDTPEPTFNPRAGDNLDSPNDLTAGLSTSGWQDQGRGSNVTSDRPLSPAESAGTGAGGPTYFGSPSIIPGGQASDMYFPGGQVPSVNIPQGGLPFFSLVTGSTVAPTTVGMPTLLLSQMGSPLLSPPPGPILTPTITTPTGQGYGGFQSPVVPPVQIPQGLYPSFQGSPFGLTNLSPTTPEMDALREETLLNTEAANRLAGLKRDQQRIIDDSIGKMAGIESGFGKFINASTSSAQGIFQFVKDTWLNSVAKFRPDIWNSFGGGTPEGNQAILDLRITDPAVQADIMRGFTQENADYLDRFGQPVTQENLYLTHFLGPKGAVDLIKADDNTPAAAVVKQDAIDANPTIFKEGTTVGDIKNWASKKMSSVDLDAARSFMDSISGGPSGTQVSSLDLPQGPVTFSYETETDYSPRNEIPLQLSEDELSGVPPIKTAMPSFDSRYSPAQAANASPSSFGDWLSGLFDSTSQVTDLEAKGRTVLFPDDWSKQQLVTEDGAQITPKEWYRQDMEEQLGRPVSMSEIKSRVVDYGNGPQVDYYIKDLVTGVSNAFSSSLKSLGNMFVGEEKPPFPTFDSRYTAGQAASKSPESFSEWLASKLNQPQKRDYGPYADLTAEEYRKLYR